MARRNLKKLYVAGLAGAAFLLSNASANAAVNYSVQRINNVTFSNGTYDIINFIVTGLDGGDATLGNQNQDAEIFGLNGTFSASVSASLATVGNYSGANSSNPKDNTSGNPYVQNDGTPPAANSSHTGESGTLFANFPNTTGVSYTLVGNQNSHAQTGTSTALTDTWYTTPASHSGPAGGVEPGQDPNFTGYNGLLAEVLVTSGGNVTFTGSYSDYGNNKQSQLLSLTSAPLVSTHPLISLTAAADANYGTVQSASLHVVGSNGSYVVSTAAVNPAAAVATVGYTGFSSPDKQIYGLQVADSSGPTGLSGELDKLVADINSGSLAGTTGVFASRTSPSPNLPAGDNLFLTFTGETLATGNLGFDFSKTNDVALTDTLSVSSVSAIPEPASAFGIVFGAAGMLLGRRKRKVLA